ncbi:B-box type zinc finger protein ncl-1 isoform X4 [Tribolium castaneum]|uniref:B-box type zinc finger protein ncl-1 isoform X4 n=1 Tax=Tribolium castaneum TaxID=7070 RepID=UPI00046C1C79|nr:PREDICTED: B-box type zinc finger protein ncl-1 isoform X4 [Tribolium castaneum]|eukprot:XP_008191666.1 PREDICTED: B-box type zinc finger protein ncl-1 isoform X4 [Tribolium castaneum]
MNASEEFPESGKEPAEKVEEFGELVMFEGNGKLCPSEALEDGLLADPDKCGMCGGSLVVSRMLHCLHSFCEDCLDKKMVGEGGDAGTAEATIECPTCGHHTKVGVKKMAALPLDVTKTNISDVSNASSLHCTSCTAKELAKSRCNTCHNLLCNHCDSAHHYMRCFESHQVVALEDMRKDGVKITIHKPLECDLHQGENLIYYCNTCNTTACSECVKNEHKGAEHHVEGIADSEMRVRQEMKALLSESKNKVDELMKLSTGLNNSLEELAHQRSTARDLINESYQSYKAVLEKCRDEALAKLNELYHERELIIMKENDEVGKTIGNFEDARSYTSRLLEISTVPEIMYLRKTVADRLLELNNNTPKCDETFHIEFRTDFGAFESMVKEHFGDFRTEKSRVSSPINSALTPLTITQPLTNGCNASITNSSPISLPTSMQSSFDGDVSGNMQNFALAQSPPLPQLATLAETSNSAATSPTPPFNLADLLTSDTAYKNLASLAKLGLNAAPTPNPNGTHTTRSNKVSPMQIRSKFGQLGPNKGQFNSPHGFCLGLEEDIIVADTNNHRIQVFDKSGVFKFQFGTSGKDEGQLWYPRKVAVMRTTGKYVVCDRGNERSRMQIFTKNGHFLKKIAIRYIDIVAGLAVTGHGEIVAVDSVSPTVFIISESGELIRWFDCSDFMREPSDIAIHGKEFYVCDFKGHNVVVFSDEGHFLRRIGYESITNFPNGIDISDAGDILIGDSHGNRFHVAVFSRDGCLISEFECPYVKVSRCCGLKITSEGYVVTLAKNNHHVLVLNTLYIL